VVWEKIAAIHKAAVYGSSFVAINGYIQREGEVVHLIARSIFDVSPLLASIGERDTPLSVPHMPGDEFRNGGPGQDARVARAQGSSFTQKSRDFR